MRHRHPVNMIHASDQQKRRTFLLVFMGAAILALLIAMTTSAAAQTVHKIVSQTSSPPSTQTVAVGDTTWSIEKLQEVQSAVRAVVDNHTGACVGIDDGSGVGSGVIVSPDGLVLTAAHVMSTDNPVYTVFFADGTTANARRLGRNLDADAGMMQLEGNRQDWPFVELGSSESLQRGDWVVSLGHSGGFELGRKPPVRSGRLLSRHAHQIITDAVLIGGDSGGPLFDLKGKLIAIHSSIGDAVSINRHAKIEQFKQDWDRLRSGQTWGNLSDLTVEPPIGKAKMGVKLDLTFPKAKIKQIKPHTAAARIGLTVGDIVIGFDGEMITDGQHLIRAVKNHIPGDTCYMTVLRNEQPLQFEIRLD